MELDKSWVDFELGEDIRTEARVAQDDAWKDTIQDARIQISRREECLIHRKELISAISDYRCAVELMDGLDDPESQLRRLNIDVLGNIIEYSYHGRKALINASRLRRDNAFKLKKKKATDNKPFSIFIRKRPIMSQELADGNFDIVDAGTETDANSVIVHHGQLARNGRRLSMTHKVYTFTQAINEGATNETICRGAVEPLLQHSMSGNSATLLCYGQTGTGKTYTLMGALEYAASRLESSNVEISFIEIHGKKCFDLLNDRKGVHLRSDENDLVQVRGAQTLQLECAKYSDIIDAFTRAIKLRRSQETERNPISSRSHAICVLRIKQPGVESAKLGKLTFVDLAGSERNYETVKMTASQHRESADINFSLMALKNCFRAYYYSMEELIAKRDAMKSADTSGRSASDTANPRSKSRVQPNTSKATCGSIYRASLLTRVLKECFSVPTMEEFHCGRHHKTTIIATVSPAAVDAHHTINTLDHVSLMDPELQKLSQSVEVEIPKGGAALTTTPLSLWSSAEVNAWLSTVENGRFSYLAVPPNFTGADLLKLDAKSMSALFAHQFRRARKQEEGEAWTEEAGTTRHEAVSRALWALLRREMDLNKLSIL